MSHDGSAGAESRRDLDGVGRLARMLAAFPLFGALDAATLETVARAGSWECVPGGTELFRQGAEADAAYIVLGGQLAALVEEDASGERLVRRIATGELVGEVGIMDGGVRTATIRALRHTELLRLDRSALTALLASCPLFGVALSRHLARTLRSAVPADPGRSRTWCAVPADGSATAARRVGDIAAAIAAATGAAIVTRDQAARFTISTFQTIENAHGHVVYLADAPGTPWTRLCLQQADEVILVADGEGPAALHPGQRCGAAERRPDHLVLCWSAGIAPARVAPWLDAVRPRRHHHARRPADVARIARLVSGRAVGLVLSGGGARGAAHLGVMQALDEHGIAYDAVCGASIGAVIGAGCVLEWDHATRVEMLKDFAGRMSALDISLSTRSLYSDRKIRAGLEAAFGAVTIEATPIPFACVSTNLGSGRLTVHGRGPLALWLRASTAVPGIFPPVIEDETVYVDGGILDNLPVAALPADRVGLTIGVDVGDNPGRSAAAGPGGRPSPPASLLELLKRVGTIASDARDPVSRAACDVMISPDVGDIGLLAWRSCDRAVEAGYRSAARVIDALRDHGDAPARGDGRAVPGMPAAAR
jgi:NTE family protein